MVGDMPPPQPAAVGSQPAAVSCAADSQGSNVSTLSDVQFLCTQDCGLEKAFVDIRDDILRTVPLVESKDGNTGWSCTNQFAHYTSTVTNSSVTVSASSIDGALSPEVRVGMPHFPNHPNPAEHGGKLYPKFGILTSGGIVGDCKKYICEPGKCLPIVPLNCQNDENCYSGCALVGDSNLEVICASQSVTQSRTDTAIGHPHRSLPSKSNCINPVKQSQLMGNKILFAPIATTSQNNDKLNSGKYRNQAGTISPSTSTSLHGKEKFYARYLCEKKSTSAIFDVSSSTPSATIPTPPQPSSMYTGIRGQGKPLIVSNERGDASAFVDRRYCPLPDAPTSVGIGKLGGKLLNSHILLQENEFTDCVTSPSSSTAATDYSPCSELVNGSSCVNVSSAVNGSPCRIGSLYPALFAANPPSMTTGTGFQPANPIIKPEPIRPEVASQNARNHAFPTQPSDLIVAAPMGSPLDCSTFPGVFGFHFEIEENQSLEHDRLKKAVPYTYSHSLNKLFVKPSFTVPIKLSCSLLTGEPAQTSYLWPDPGHLLQCLKRCHVRVTAVFSNPSQVHDPVRACPVHISANSDDPSKHHFIRAKHKHAVYSTDPGGRDSVAFLWGELGSMGSQIATSITGFYTFACYSSCVGGINRRKLTLIISLELE